MIKTIKIVSVFLLTITMIACGNGDGGMEGQEEDMEEGIEMGMEQYWMEQREEFIYLVEERLNGWEVSLEVYDDGSTASDIESDIENIREKLTELQQTERAEWEEKREEIASDINDLRHKMEDLE
ncbi:hypothetical protein BH23BAC3_BH23BAC3_16370 [soil metagenome]